MIILAGSHGFFKPAQRITKKILDTLSQLITNIHSLSQIITNYPQFLTLHHSLSQFIASLITAYHSLSQDSRTAYHNLTQTMCANPQSQTCHSPYPRRILPPPPSSSLLLSLLSLLLSQLITAYHKTFNFKSQLITTYHRKPIY